MASDVPTVLVTGASGYVATHIVQQLLQSGLYKVRGTVRSTRNEQKIAPLKNLVPNARYPLELVEGDLSDEKPWINNVKGCTYVLHTASPFPAEAPKNEDEVIRPAVDGTMNVLKACRAVGGVKRVVLTSSVAAVSNGFDVGGTYSEDDWTNAKDPSTSAYYKSKTLAEKAAWDYLKTIPESERFELSVVNPGFIMGPVLCGGFTTSMEFPKRLLQHEMPMLPKLNFCIVDVRDVAKSHINAMTIPEANGNRILLHSGNIWVAEIAKILKEEFHSQGYNVPTSVAPNLMVRISGLFNPGTKLLTTSLGKVTQYKSDKMKRVLGINPIPIKQTMIEMAYSMIEAGKIKKTNKYTGPKSTHL